MQKALNINTKDSKTIYGLLDKSNSNTNRIVIYVHGFTGSKNEYQYLSSIPFFNSKEIAVFRFNLYGSEDNARKSSEVSLQDHISDTNTVIEYLAKEFSEIYLVGHSLGGPVAAFANQEKVKKLVLWDPTTGFPSLEAKGMTFVEELNVYLCNTRIQTLFGKDLIEDWMKITIEDQLKSIKVPVKIIFAGNYNKYDQWKDFLGGDPVKGNFDVIEGASHQFLELGITEKLHELTYEYINY